MAQSLISFPAGTRVRQPLAFVDAAGSVVNLTGVDPLAVYISRENTTVLTASLANAKLTVTNAAGGLARVDLEAEDTEDLHGEYKYEAWGTLSSVSQLLGRGTLIISRTRGAV
jgi:hypothetical protein